MNLKSLLSKWKLEKLSINAVYLQAELSFNNADKKAAWEMYVELLTRITTQPLGAQDGDEKTALDSIYSLFGTTRQVLKDNGPKCENFAKIAVIILNQIIRPFTAKWHRLSLQGAFQDTKQCKQFREELALLQIDLTHYTQLLADMADVEDLTKISD